MSRKLFKKPEAKVEETLKAAQVDTCGTIVCGSNIPYCVSVDIPDPTCLAISSGTGSTIICSNNLSCVLERCTREIPITVPNPCGGADLVCTGSVTLLKAIVRGSVELTVGVPVVLIGSGTSCGPAITMSRTVTLPIDTVVCVRCDDQAITCADIFPGGITLTCTAPSIPSSSTSDCGDKTIARVQGSFDIGGFTC